MKRKAAYNDDSQVPLARSAEKKLARFEERETPTERPKDQDVRIGIAGGRTGKMALRLTGLSIPACSTCSTPRSGSASGSGSSGRTGPARRTSCGSWPARRCRTRASGAWERASSPGCSGSCTDRADLKGVPIVEPSQKRGMSTSEAMAMLNRYELSCVGRNLFELLSGGQQARLQLLLMEVESPTMLLLDEPTDNLDVASAEALEDAPLVRGHGDRRHARPMVHAADGPVPVVRRGRPGPRAPRVAVGRRARRRGRLSRRRLIRVGDAGDRRAEPVCELPSLGIRQLGAGVDQGVLHRRHLHPRGPPLRGSRRSPPAADPTR